MRFRFFAALLALGLVACGERDQENGHEEDAHGHEAKHGGALVELGDHEGFLEVKVDHDAGTAAIWVYAGEEMKEATLSEPPVLNLKTVDGPKQITGTGAGAAWTFRDEALKQEPEGARFRLVFNGNSYSPNWHHEH